MRWLAVILAFVCVALFVLGLGGCRFSKDGVLSAYESVVQFAGQFALTPAIQLQGVRAFGEDHFQGTYRAEYENFSGTEYLFGGTSTVGRDVRVTFSLEAENGGGTLFLMSGKHMLEVLLDAQGGFERTLTLPSGSSYIGFTAKGLTGTLEMRLAPGAESGQDVG